MSFLKPSLVLGGSTVDMSDYKEGVYIFRTENGEVERVVKL